MRISTFQINRERVYLSLVVLFFFITLGCLFSCQHFGTSTSPATIDIRAGLVAPKAIPLSTIADSIEVIHFNPPEGQSFRLNHDILVLDTCIIIDMKGYCSLFDRKGHFIRTIAKSGKEPGDYGYACSLHFYDNLIYISSSQKQTNIYSLEGKLVDSIPHASLFYDVTYPLNDDEWVGFRSNCDGKTGVRLEFYNRDTVFNRYVYTQAYTPKDIFYFANEGQFIETPNRLLFKQMINDTIYNINRQTHDLKPAYILNLGEYAGNDSIRFTLNNPNRELFLQTPYIDLIGETNTALWFVTVIGLEEEQKQVYATHAFDRKTNQTYSFELKISTEEMGKSSIHFYDSTENIPPSINWDNYLPTQMTCDGRCLVAVRQNTLVLAHLKEDPLAAFRPASPLSGWKAVLLFMLFLSVSTYYAFAKYKNSKRQLQCIRKEMSENEATIAGYRKQIQEYKELSAQPFSDKTDELEQKIYLLNLQNQELSEQLKTLAKNTERKKLPETLSVTDEGYNLFMKLKAEPSYVFIGEKEHAYLCRVTDELYQQFASRLRAHYPDLTKHDIETCCLLKAGLSNQQLSIIFNNTPAAITKSKNRIKKRMGLGNDINLDCFLLEWH